MTVTIDRGHEKIREEARELERIECTAKLTPQKAAVVDDGFFPNRNSLPSRPAGLHVLLITLRHLVPQNYMLPNGLLMVIGFSAL